MTDPSRRLFLAGAAALATSGAHAQAVSPFEALERRHGGRLGVALIDANANVLAAHRSDDRFSMCSTHKLLSATFALRRAERGEESLSRRVEYTKDELVT